MNGSGTPRVGLAVGLLCTAALTVGLGFWQLRRNATKQAWIADMHARLAATPAPLADALADPNAFAFRRVAAAGTLAYGDSILVDHQSLGPHEGSHVVTPLALPGRAKLVLVDRGFVAYGDAERFLAADRARAPATARIEGALEPLEREELAPSDAPSGGRIAHWNKLHLGALERQLGQPVESALLVRAPQPGDTEPLSALPEPRSRVDHMEYAITWFAIAAIAVAIAAFELSRPRASAAQ
jgi:surfeit locus 1 family protein